MSATGSGSPPLDSVSQRGPDISDLVFVDTELEALHISRTDNPYLQATNADIVIRKGVTLSIDNDCFSGPVLSRQSRQWHRLQRDHEPGLDLADEIHGRHVQGALLVGDTQPSRAVAATCNLAMATDRNRK